MKRSPLFGQRLPLLRNGGPGVIGCFPSPWTKTVGYPFAFLNLVGQIRKDFFDRVVCEPRYTELIAECVKSSLRLKKKIMQVVNCKNVWHVNKLAIRSGAV